MGQMLKEISLIWEILELTDVETHMLLTYIYIGAFFIIWLASMAGVALFITLGEEIKPKPDNDVFKLTYQFLTIVVLGGALSFLYQLHAKRRDRYHERLALSRELHSELLDAYNVAKGVRRNLRADLGYDSGTKSFHPNAHLAAVQYSEQLATLMGAQLMFERYAIQAEDNQLWFKPGVEFARSLRTIESYLNKIIDEYADKIKRFQGTPPVMPLSKLPKLMSFVDSAQNSPDHQRCFRAPMKYIRTSLVPAGLK